MTARSNLPASWSWPTDVADLAEFHAGRCGICGQHRELVRDHCHDTGWIRGLLCQRCNTLEGGGWAGNRTFRLYRKNPPAKIQGIWERYSTPRGPDHGKLQGLETVDPHIVTTDGTVLLVSLLGRDHRSGEPQWFDAAKHARPTSAESQ